MSLLTRAADLTYSFRFLTLLVTPFEETNAYKLGVIDETGKRINKNSPLSHDQKAAYNSFHKLVFNIKKLLAKVPGGSSRIASYAAALYLLKEHFGVKEKEIKKSLNVDPLDFMLEQTEWFVLEDMRLSPGSYKVLSEKLLNDTYDEVVLPRDKVSVGEDCYPVGEMFGLNIYEVTHCKTRKNIYVAVSELSR